MESQPELDGLTRALVEGLRFEPLLGIDLEEDFAGVGIDVVAADQVRGDDGREAVGID
jgi:hypothetical protein